MRIVQYPHPALRHPAKPVPVIDKDLRRIIGRMLELMYEQKGLGLAAPQVAIPFQLFVCNFRAGEDERGTEHVFINPVIIEKKGSYEAEEGCLSFPGLFQKVRRAKTIRVQAYDQEGKPKDLVLHDLQGRVVQHETDHLHGILFIDKFTEIGRLASRGNLAEFERDFKKAQEKGDWPATKAIQRQLKEMEARTSFEGLM